jgi:transposase InsO family protein
MQFLSRLKAGERMSDLCREFGISEKTGYKFKARYEQLGVFGLTDQSRAPRRIPHRTPRAVIDLLIEERKRHPTWGGRKLKAYVENHHPELVLPSATAIAGWMKRAGLVQSRRKRSDWPRSSTGLTEPSGPNDVWCADFKGEFRLGNGRYCYPLTITDQFSRYLIACEARDSTRTEGALEVFEYAFRAFGLPSVIRSDNGAPFASTALAGLSKLSAWWMRLGIKPERIEPAHPEQNGRHERMHRTLKRETTRPAGRNELEQQERFDRFVDEYNQERPHEALGQKPPATAYTASSRSFPTTLPGLEYPLHDDVRIVKKTGHIALGGQGNQYFLTHALAEQAVGIREEEDGRLLVSYMSLDLARIDRANRRLEPIA